MSNDPGSDLIQKPTKIVVVALFRTFSGLAWSYFRRQVLVRPFTTVDKDVPSRSIVDSSGIKTGVLTDERISRLAKKQIYQRQDNNSIQSMHLDPDIENVGIKVCTMYL